MHQPRQYTDCSEEVEEDSAFRYLDLFTSEYIGD